VLRRHAARCPPQPEETEDQIASIVRYARELQAANGIIEKPHRM